MPSITFSVKLDTERDADLVAWLQSSESRSQEIKAALYSYRNLPPPPPPNNNLQPPPMPPVIDMDLLKEIIDYAVDRGAEKIGARVADKLSERLEGMTFPIPLNEEKKKKKEPEKPKIDADKLFAEAMAGFDTWGN